MKQPILSYETQFSSFSGCNILAAIKIQNTLPYILGTLSQISISTHRPAYEVLALGSIRPKGFTRGPRVVAGQLTFVAFDNHLMYKLSQFLGPANYIGKTDLTNVEKQLQLSQDEHEDELPLFDIVINQMNEDRRASHMVIYGIQLVDSQLAVGTNVVVPEISYTYVAIDYKPLTKGMFDHSNFKSKYQDIHPTAEAI